tara:strand:+ start:1330 stop:1581 length:252 start_codon:yes stop_codon:yes gene_type:complete
MKNTEIVKYKITNTNKNGTINQLFNIKLLGIDSNGTEHYIRFISEEFANDLIRKSQPHELVNELLSADEYYARLDNAGWNVPQ